MKRRYQSRPKTFLYLNSQDAKWDPPSAMNLLHSLLMCLPFTFTLPQPTNFRASIFYMFCFSISSVKKTKKTTWGPQMTKAVLHWQDDSPDQARIVLMHSNAINAIDRKEGETLTVPPLHLPPSSVVCLFSKDPFPFCSWMGCCVVLDAISTVN